MVRPIVNRFTNAEQVADAVGEELFKFVREALVRQDRVDVALTGGTVGIASLASASTQPFNELDLSRLHFWWGDERFVEQASDERNDRQAEIAWLRKLSIPESNLHRFPARTEGLDVETASQQFAEVAKTSFHGFDLMLMGMGPDGHVASLFPGQESLKAYGVAVAVPNSPKPPSERISFSYDSINKAKQIWFTVAGADKADAVFSVFEHQEPALPAARIQGKEKTVWFIDQTAGNLVWGC
jgi:6-phosphogluconolactonase